MSEKKQVDLCTARAIMVEDAAIKAAILGALQTTINEHGPITSALITSATKRIFGGLKPWLNQNSSQK